jgi:DNA-binding HxlR family transcriptional regulator
MEQPLKSNPGPNAGNGLEGKSQPEEPAEVRIRPPESAKVTDESLEMVGSVLSDATRWRILFELRKGDELPVGELAKRVHRAPDSISKHMAYLRRAGLVERVFSTCYKLRDGLRTDEGIDLGPCVMKGDFRDEG